MYTAVDSATGRDLHTSDVKKCNNANDPPLMLFHHTTVSVQ